MQPAKPKKLSPLKWMLGVLGLVGVILFASVLGLSLQPIGSAPDETELSAGLGRFVIGLGGVFVVAGGVASALVMLSNCFISNFNRPYLPTYKGRLWAFNLLIGILFQMGFALMLWPMLVRVAVRLVPQAIAVPLSAFVPFLLAQIFLVWFSMWTGLGLTLIRKRLAACGVTPQQLAVGIPMGISDPQKNSMKKMPFVEEDFGMLWISADQLFYRGDAMGFDVKRAQMIQVERKADAGSVSAYFGAVHVIVRFLQSDGTERRIRLHPQTAWTMTGTAGELDRLAQKIERWAALPSDVETNSSGAPAS